MRAPLPLLFVLGITGCRDGALSDPGRWLDLRVQGAQLADGAVPDGDDDGPPITSLEVLDPVAYPGEAGKLLSGRTTDEAFAIHMGLDGDSHHWILPSGLPDDVVADELKWSARLDFSAGIDLGAAPIEIAAVDGHGRVGSRTSIRFEVIADELAGPLVFALEWDRDVDLDLHVVDPNGVEIHAKNVNSAPSGDPDWSQGGMLDYDSNAGCVIDGRRLERVGWPEGAPPPGRYRVYADLFSACGQPMGNFRLTIRRDGIVERTVLGSVYPSDASYPSPGVPGLLLTDFEY